MFVSFFFFFQNRKKDVGDANPSYLIDYTKKYLAISPSSFNFMKSVRGNLQKKEKRENRENAFGNLIHNPPYKFD